ncbi:chemotaxis protein MotA [Clostridium cavendishii DSM 21758]|uniref:Chemotaxis protein MotA n=1 Tax=Clostridium cavendishii DSM 21758 TaxID=1121302 RepID=A0A1M6AU56_9CLOT|nr:MotA/TolQ/ExbB proton channel family protein [Clostridium cavendishii]SHI40059.1 chemotaxis protein MotA [Clostridium cavendishii DSM 21758]
MKKSDSLTLIGLILSSIVIIIFITIQGNLIMFLNIKALLITIIGSFSAMLITYSKEDIKNLKFLFKEFFKFEQSNKINIIKKLIDIAKISRKEGFLALDRELYNIEDEFFKKSIQFVVDGMSLKEITDILEAEIYNIDKRHKKFISMFKNWAVYAQVFGFVGTLIGIMSGVYNITDTNMLTNSIEVSIVSTFYGLILAYLILNPISLKLTNKNAEEIEIKKMILDAIVGIQDGITPAMLQEKLYIYMSSREKKEYLDVKKDEDINE